MLFHKVNSIPSTVESDALYFLKNNKSVELYVSSSGGSPEAFPVRDISVRSNRNKIINGNFNWNQRGIGTTVASGVFRFDRWKGGSSGCTASTTTSGADTLVTITSGTLCQVVDPNDIENGNYVLSWSGTATIRVQVNSGTWTSYATSPIYINNVSAFVPIVVEIGTGTVTCVQLEVGTVVTTFDRLTKHEELLRCMRYYSYFNGEYQMVPAPAATFGGNVYIPFPVFMRAVPTLSIGYVSFYAVGTYTSHGLSQRGYWHLITGNTNTNVTATWNWAATAEL